MPKSNPSRRINNKPPVPQVLPETWRPLLSAADAFGTLAPWVWMHDSELVGLRHPTSGGVYLGSILGRLRTVFALLLYRGETGHRWLLNTILNDGDSGGFDDEDTAFEQDCVKVEFTAKADLTQEDRAVLKTAGFSPRIRRGRVWPAFRSLVPGGYPWYPTQTEAEALLWALPRVSAFATLWRDTPNLGEPHEAGEVPFLPPDFDPAKRTLRPEDLDWHPMIIPPHPKPEPVSLGESELAQFLKLPQPQGFHLEIDLFYSQLAATGPDRPYFPKAAMAVDRASGFIGGFHLADHDDARGASAVAHVLVNTLRALKCRPGVLCVQRAILAKMLLPVANQLGIPLRTVSELHALNDARQDLQRTLLR